MIQLSRSFNSPYLCGRLPDGTTEHRCTYRSQIMGASHHLRGACVAKDQAAALSLLLFNNHHAGFSTALNHPECRAALAYSVFTRYDIAQACGRDFWGNSSGRRRAQATEEIVIGHHSTSQRFTSGQLNFLGISPPLELTKLCCL